MHRIGAVDGNAVVSLGEPSGGAGDVVPLGWRHITVSLTHHLGRVCHKPDVHVVGLSEEADLRQQGAHPLGLVGVAGLLDVVVGVDHCAPHTVPHDGNLQSLEYRVKHGHAAICLIDKGKVRLNKFLPDLQLLGRYPLDVALEERLLHVLGYELGDVEARLVLEAGDGERPSLGDGEVDHELVNEL